MSQSAAITTPTSVLFGVAAVLCATIALAGCGSSHAAGDRVAGTKLTIYTSVPLHGPSAVTGEAILNAERMALDQANSRVGKYTIELEALDDSTAQTGKWNPVQTTTNALAAAQDGTTIGYIGDVNSGASAVSIPVLNRAEIAQISPTSTAVGLTSAASGAAPGEPLKYYPTGTRTFARVVPNDSVQASVMVKLQQAQGCKKTYVLQDGEVDGEDMATSFELAARAASLPVAAVQLYDAKATHYASLASSIAQAGADCVLLSALTESNAVSLTTQIADALPQVLIFGSAGLAESTYTDASQGGIPFALDSRVFLTAPTLDWSADPPMGSFWSDYQRRFGTGEPDAIFGYEAMNLMLDAIGRATDDGTGTARRTQVISEIFATHDLPSVVGTYSINSDGDTSLDRYGAYRVSDGQMQLWKTIVG